MILWSAPLKHPHKQRQQRWRRARRSCSRTASCWCFEKGHPKDNLSAYLVTKRIIQPPVQKLSHGPTKSETSGDILDVLEQGLLETFSWPSLKLLLPPISISVFCLPKVFAWAVLAPLGVFLHKRGKVMDIRGLVEGTDLQVAEKKRKFWHFGIHKQIMKAVILLTVVAILLPVFLFLCNTVFLLLNILCSQFETRLSRDLARCPKTSKRSR